MAPSYHRLRLILGDQLNALHSWFVEQDGSTLYVIAELHEEATYVTHHVQKVCAFFDAMGSFARHLRKAGHHVLHLTLDDTEVDGCVEHLLIRLAKEYCVSNIEYQQPDEHRLRYVLSRLLIDGVTITECDSEHFVLAFDDLPQWVPPAKSVRMETFYRRIRVQQNVLMEGDKPVGGQWNFDAQNRKRLQKKDLASIPAPLTFLHDVSPILDRLDRHGIPTIGVRNTNLTLPHNRSESLQLLSYFCEQLLPRFG
ncbi:MAG: cryptochrome/photolyase family protein, partial [Pseudomonadota bacterium]